VSGHLLIIIDSIYHHVYQPMAFKMTGTVAMLECGWRGGALGTHLVFPLPRPIYRREPDHERTAILHAPSLPYRRTRAMLLTDENKLAGSYDA